MIQDQKSTHRDTGNTNSSSSSSSKKKEKVAPLRKQALLLEARRNRVEWVEAAAVPYKKNTTTKSIISNDHNHANSDVSSYHNEEEEEDDGLNLLRKARVCESMKSVVDVVSNLYGINSASASVLALSSDRVMVEAMSNSNGGDGSQRATTSYKIVHNKIIKQLLSQVSSEESKRVLGTLRDGHNEEEEGEKEDIKPSLNSLQSHLDDYERFIQRLRSPEAAEMVQGMRHFVTCFDDAAKMSIEKKNSRKQRDQNLRAMGAVYARAVDIENNDDSPFVGMTTENEDAKAASGTIWAYLNLAMDSLKTNVLWKKELEKENISGQMSQMRSPTRDSLENFIFQKIYDCCYAMACDDEKDEELSNMLEALQFVSWKHLDLNCLRSCTRKASMDEEESKLRSNDDDFPISKEMWLPVLESVNSIDLHWSPSAKIQQMNRVLKQIANVLQSVDNGKSGSLPGSDDILPLLILAIIKAHPKKLYSNLLFTQYYATHEQLRGEGGFILTQFQSAVQFLLGVDSGSFTIDSSEFEAELAKCRRTVEPNQNKDGLPGTRKLRREKKNIEGKNKCNDEEEQEDEEVTSKVDVPISEIRNAIGRGETINVEWVQHWHAKKHENESNQDKDFFMDEAARTSPKTRMIGRDRTSSSSKAKNVASRSMAYSTLPPDFSRNYTYLGSRPNDIKFSDIPILLDEYQQLVRVCELMLKERSAMMSAEHKRKIKLARDQLENSVIAASERKGTDDSFNSIIHDLTLDPVESSDDLLSATDASI